MDLKRLLECIDGPIERINNELISLADGFESKLLTLYSRYSSQTVASKRTEILRWISPEPYNQHHEQAKREVLAGTGQWLLSDPLFNRWKKESVSSILWLHGPPGSGKSKLVWVSWQYRKLRLTNSIGPSWSKMPKQASRIVTARLQYFSTVHETLPSRHAQILMRS